MSLLSVTPDAIASASADLVDIGASLRAAQAEAMGQTAAIAAPGADEVSAAITSVFGRAADEFHSLGVQAAAYHDNFVGALSGGAGQYAGAEAANVRQMLAGGLDASAQSVSGTFFALNTPIGAINFTYSGILPPTGQNGPFSGVVNGTTAVFGSGSLAVTGNVLTGPYGPGTELQVTGGNFSAPRLLSLVSSTAGPAVSGNAALVNSTNLVVSELQPGNWQGAASALVGIPGNYLAAVTTGSTTVNLAVDTSSFGGPVVTVGVPFDGIFASPQPITASWPTFDYSFGGTLYTVEGVNDLPIGSTAGLVPFALDVIARSVGLP